MPQVLAGEKIIALAITEPSGGSDVANSRPRGARRRPLRGQWLQDLHHLGARADYYTAAVRTGEVGFGGVSLLLIEKGTPGFTVGRNLKKMGWWASDTAELFFQDCRVPADNLLGPENSGFFTIMANFQAERLSPGHHGDHDGADGAGAMPRLHEGPRTTFGKPLSNTRSSATSWPRWPRR